MTMQGITEQESVRMRALWAVAEKAGLHRANTALQDSLTAYEQVLDGRRVAKAELDERQAEYEDQIGLARQVHGRKIVKEGTKTYVPDEDGRRQVTADDAKAWLERIVAQDDDVISAAKPLAAARLRLEETEDRVKVAERRISSTKYQTDSAVALTNLLSTAFKETTQ